MHLSIFNAVPMFRDLQAKSPKCDTTRARVNLKDITRMARDFDEQNDRTPFGKEVPKPLNLTGVAFHESRCGSTLVANTLIGMNPSQHRVYSESPPPITAMKVCGERYESCTIDHAVEVLKDAIYMMSRTNDPQEQRVFFKIQSIGSRHIEVFRRAFPTTPWIYVYRDPVQVRIHVKCLCDIQYLLWMMFCHYCSHNQQPLNHTPCSLLFRS